jgi:hypothetical protein
MPVELERRKDLQLVWVPDLTKAGASSPQNSGLLIRCGNRLSSGGFSASEDIAFFRLLFVEEGCELDF